MPVFSLGQLGPLQLLMRLLVTPFVQAVSEPAEVPPQFLRYLPMVMLGAQEVQVLEPQLVWYVPGAQGLQVPEPALALYLPM